MVLGEGQEVLLMESVMLPQELEDQIIHIILVVLLVGLIQLVVQILVMVKVVLVIK